MNRECVLDNENNLFNKSVPALPVDKTKQG